MSSESIYLDNAATSFPKPDCVYEAVDSYQRQVGAAFGRGVLSTHADSLAERCRHRLAQLIGASTHQSVAFTFNGTDGLNLLLRGILQNGNSVLTTTLEHNSVLRPLQQLQEQREISVEHLPFDAATGQMDIEGFREACHRTSPDLVVLNMVSNVTGVSQPIAELASTASAAGALVLVDAAQAVGHIPIDVQALGIDLLAAPGHKGLLGPLGTGFVYVNPTIGDRLVSYRCGGTGTESESLQQPTDMPQLLESGNLNMPGVAGLDAALKWRQSSMYDDLHERHQRQVPDFIGRLNAVSGLKVYCGESAADNVGVVSLSVKEMEPHDLAMILSESFGIQSRAGLHCAPLAHRTLGTESQGGTVRLSPGLFTTDDQLDLALSALESIASTV